MNIKGFYSLDKGIDTIKKSFEYRAEVESNLVEALYKKGVKITKDNFLDFLRLNLRKSVDYGYSPIYDKSMANLVHRWLNSDKDEFEEQRIKLIKNATGKIITKELVILLSQWLFYLTLRSDKADDCIEMFCMMKDEENCEFMKYLQKASKEMNSSQCADLEREIKSKISFERTTYLYSTNTINDVLRVDKVDAVRPNRFEVKFKRGVIGSNKIADIEVLHLDKLNDGKTVVFSNKIGSKEERSKDTDINNTSSYKSDSLPETAVKNFAIYLSDRNIEQIRKRVSKVVKGRVPNLSMSGSRGEFGIKTFANPTQDKTSYDKKGSLYSYSKVLNEGVKVYGN